MAFAICTLSSISVLESPEFDAKRVYELLFGETLVMVDRGKVWCEVRVPGSDQNGWIMEGQYEIVNEPMGLERIVDDMGGYAVTGEDTTIELYYGSPLPVNAKLQTDRAEYGFLGEGRLTNTSFKIDRDKELLEEFVVTYLHTPFAFKGRTKHGLDPIGLCDLFYRQFGIDIPSTLESVLTLGRPVDFISEIEAGDIAFFEDQEGQVNHVGIVISPEDILHVVEKVRIDSLDDEGIFNHTKQLSTHKLRIVKRLF